MHIDHPCSPALSASGVVKVTFSRVLATSLVRSGLPGAVGSPAWVSWWGSTAALGQGGVVSHTGSMAAFQHARST